ncbi:hypothetical protein [Algicola sagamiensis]|uniref:hypothetical protein n=1 Tax=Algicola sagamiensis TaxID=163869 RepID=UPI000379A775|nr:hypothetical protein [Algicola sagamiensis]
MKKLTQLLVVTALTFISHTAVAAPDYFECKFIQQSLEDLYNVQRRAYFEEISHYLKGREQSLRERFYRLCSEYSTESLSLAEANYTTRQELKEVPSTTEAGKLRLEAISPAMGRKVEAWYQYYKQPRVCSHAGNMSMFVDCVEFRKQAKEIFELAWTIYHRDTMHASN